MDIHQTVSQMTLEEKAGLLSGLDFWHTKPVERLGVQSCMVSDGPHGLRKQDEKDDHLGVNDSIRAVCFPAGCATAASFDRDLLRTLGEAIGDACQHERLSVVLGPAVNIKRSPLCGRNFEYYSEDPYLAAEAAVGFIQGVQSRNVGTSVKHFAGNNQEHRRMSSNSVIDERTLREIYLPAFEAAVQRAKAWTVMCSYNRVNGVYASENRWLLTDLLRKEWGFDGYVMSDWGAVDDRVDGVAAGLDLEMPSSAGENDKLIVKAVREGRLSEELVDRSCERILTVNQRYLAHSAPETPWDKAAQHTLARGLAAECMVLLKNERGVLPINMGQKIAVIGKFAKQPRYQGGGSSHINTTQVTGAWELLGEWPNATYADGYDMETGGVDERLLAEAEAAARGADVAVVFVGLPDLYESEGYDRTHLRMPENQEKLVARVAAANPNTVVVLHNGAPLEMPWLGLVPAVLEAYLGGQAVGAATVDVLCGATNPCGRLPESFPLHLEDNPSYPWYGGEKDTVEYREGILVGYRWYDQKKMPVLFPFGHGLSYTTFRYGNLRLSAAEIQDTDELTVSVDVTNAGLVAGKEVVQLYVADRESTVLRPVRELKEFAKVFLTPGETKTVRFTLCKRAFAYWNITLHDWHVETGVFAIQIGRSSRDIVLEEEVRVLSTTALPEHVTLNSIFMDLMSDPPSAAILQPLMDKSSLNGDQDDAQGGQAAVEAISPEMQAAMFGYMPLRALLSFAGGKITYEDLSTAVEQLNRIRSVNPPR
ncbi:MAG: glycoside hydrolase family 3 C-terminal domain-containing protein [Eubacteriales bacterium]|nr:glycoside hydrolase family 3 C-terminal domain-containing protein [Eubacteriales bacterium]